MRCDEGELARRAAVGEPAAWAELLAAHRAAIVRRLARLSAQEADDLFADLCLALLDDGGRRLRAFDPARGSLRAFLVTVARNLALNRLRRPPERPIEAEPAADRDGPLDELIARERAQLARALLATLGARDAELVRLHVIEARPPREVARAMGVTETTVYTKKHKLARRLGALAAAPRAA